MLIVVTGGSGSGKSEYAENLLMSLSQDGKDRIYIATMRPFDRECEERIKRHRSMRKEKKFTTMECYEGLEKLSIEKPSAVLLECLSNLTANEMYKENIQSEQDIADRITEAVLELSKRMKHVVVVTNEIFSDGICYGKETMAYIRALGEINRRLSARADRVAEVVCGIPVIIKEER